MPSRMNDDAFLYFVYGTSSRIRLIHAEGVGAVTGTAVI